MAYSIRQDIRDAFPRIDTVVLDEPEYAAIFRKWDAIIDGYLAVKYVVPFQAVPNTPPLIRQISMTFAKCDILRRTQRMEDWVRAELEETWEMLKAIAAGTLALVDVNGTIIEPRTDQEPVISNTSEYVPVFGAVPSLGERFDPERRIDEASNRHEITVFPER